MSTETVKTSIVDQAIVRGTRQLTDTVFGDNLRQFTNTFSCGVQGRMVLVVIFFRIFEIVIVCFVVHGGKSKGTTCVVDRDVTTYIVVDRVLRLSTE